MDSKCPICLKSARLALPKVMTPEATTVYDVSCERCGEYRISMVAAADRLVPDEKRHILSGIVRNCYEQGEPPVLITTENVEAILDSMSVPSGPHEAIDLLLKHLCRKGGKASKAVPFDIENDYPIVFAENHEEFGSYLRMARESGYIERDPLPANMDVYRLLLKGWQRLRELDERAKQEPGLETGPEAIIQLGEVPRVFDNIKKEIEASSLEEDFKEVALCDLEQAKLAYQSGAFKACIVMLGAVLEGSMLGTISRADVLQRIRTDSPKVVKKLGLNDPQLDFCSDIT